MDTAGTNREGSVKEEPRENRDDCQEMKTPADPIAAGSSGDGPPPPPPPSHADVLCDSCIESPCKAFKSCLTCLVSYCEPHLRPHLGNARFQNHRLVEPLHDIECQTCGEHRLPLELFCLTDGRCVCLGCESQEHQGHETVPTGDARKQIETELQKEQVELTKTVAAAEKAIGKLQSNAASAKSSMGDVCVDVEKQFSRLQEAVEEARKAAVGALEDAQRQARKQAEGIETHLEQRKAELKKTLVQMQRMTRIKSDVDFLQESSEWKTVAVDKCLPAVHRNLIDHVAAISQVVTVATQEVCDQILSCFAEKIKSECRSGIKVAIQTQMAESQQSSLPDPESREDLLKYSRSLKFDPDTAHHFLRLTEDNTKLTNTSPWHHSYPDNPARFGYWRQAMTSESLYQGRHYFELELSGEGAHVGATYKSIDRKGEESSSCITGNDFSWCLGRNQRGFSLWHDNAETPLATADITRIGLYIDFSKGFIAFYDVTGPLALLHKYKADFVEPLYAAAWLSKKDNMVFSV